ncbi:hypothetical protein [Streptomyces hydrogenans]|uniref:Uncharacterized protein n=1 Tax=Streptomyces hydrogenans TaxID=1873719 RepID=A0ABQ3PQG2_9ACTN|nr:hypothetical protein [Streptomyces hydrogenans]GHG24648.1 hypothetical protein GCM10018784_42560 [Streptomyces hydrogenans]GHI27269.1 hypothetical protein Shyd_86400 [Streptomyces hydrogenans]
MSSEGEWAVANAYTTEPFIVSWKKGEEQEEELVNHDIPVHISAAIVREAAANLARIAGRG